MADTNSRELHNQLGELTDKFAQRLRLELPELANLADKLLQLPTPDHRPILEIQQQLHRLAGTAGTFGFHALGEQARRLEQCAENWLQDSNPSKEALAAFAKALRQLSDEALAGRYNAPFSELQTQQTLAPGQRIYLLKNDTEAGNSMRQTLDGFGYEVQVYSDLSSLEAAIARQLPDALIISLQQDRDLTAIGQLQQQLAAPLPLLVINDRFDFDSQLGAVRAGAQGYFTRPVDITQLENSLERCLFRQLNEPYRVLIIDDDDDLAARYSLVLRNFKMMVQTVSDPVQLFEVMRDFKPDVLLLDVNMPKCSGPELAQMIRLDNEWLRVTIIYLSAETDIKRQMDALLKAGDDFLTKPISDSALIASVYSHAQRARSLSAALSRDGLTGLLKHADIKEQLAVEVQRCARNGTRSSIAMLDIDHFKRVNDRYGHAAGDNVIRSLAHLLRQRLRRIDSLGRYGGEEFVVVLPDCTAEQARLIFDQIRQRFAALPFHVGEQTFHVSFSVGISETDGHSTPALVLEYADQALYAAKHGGRNQVRLAHHS